MMYYFTRILLIPLLSIVLVTGSSGQSDLTIGEWKEHFPYNVGSWVTQSESHVFYATSVSLLALNKEDLSPTFYSKLDGLNDVNPKIVNYHQGLDILFIVYENSNIDLMTAEGIFNANDILINDNILGSKDVNTLRFARDTAFLATDFGLVSYDLKQQVFGFTCFTDFPVYDFTEWNGRYYMATENGLYSAPIQAGFNYAFLGNWTQIQGENGWPSQYFSKALRSWKGDLYADVNDRLFRWDGTEAVEVMEKDGFDLQFLQEGEDQLLIGWNCRSGCSSDELLFYKGPGDITASASNCIGNLQFAIQEENSNRIFYADNYREFRRADEAGASCHRFDFEGPKNEKAYDILFHPDGSVWVTSGGVTSEYQYNFNADGIYVLQDGSWSVYDRFNVEEFGDPDPVLDFLQLAVHPQTNKVYCSTYFAGLVRFDGEDVTVYDQENSCLQGAVGDESRERIPDIAFDENGTLWMSNYLASEPIVAMTADGECYNFNVPGESLLTRLTIDDNGFKWFGTYGSGSGIVLFDEGEIDDAEDNQIRILSSNNSALPSDYINCITTDLDGSIWAGTRDGAVVFECGSAAFDEDICSGNRPIVEQDGILSYLLEGENVLSIAVDGANRKWFGTENGIFVQSPSGEQQEMRFTTSNSPLPSNFIRTINVHPETGEVFIGTEQGIVVYRSEATVGTTVHAPDVYAFPNPVRPDYSGPIAIKGLPRDATVKITDVNGQLVHETQAQGGQAIWNGRNYNGRKASSGVYLVFSSSESLFGSKPDVLVTKILFIN